MTSTYSISYYNGGIYTLTSYYARIGNGGGLVTFAEPKRLIGGLVSSVITMSNKSTPAHLSQVMIDNISPNITKLPKLSLTSGVGSSILQPDRITLPINQSFSLQPLLVEQFDIYLQYFVEGTGAYLNGSIHIDITLLFEE